MPQPSASPEPLLLTPAEMAVVFQLLLGPAAADGGLLGNLDLSPPALSAARGRLVERGLLLPAPGRADPKTFIAPAARALLGAVTRPVMLCVLRVMPPGQPEHGAHFCWTPEMLVFNSVDAQGNHRLEPLTGLESLADRALAVSHLENFQPTPGPLPATPNAIGLGPGLRGVFMAVASARTAHEQVRGLAWRVSAGRLWLMAPPPASAGGAKAARPSTPDAGLRCLPLAELRAAILAAATQAVEHTQSVLQPTSAQKARMNDEG